MCVKVVKEEFVLNGILEYVIVMYRDIEWDGFLKEMVGRVDAVFLDLSGSYKCVGSVACSFCLDGVFCLFLLCIE